MDLSNNTEQRKLFSIKPTYWKAVIIAVLTLLLLIPMSMIGDIIYERANSARQAEYEVQTKYSSRQRIFAPTLTVPYYTYRTTYKDSVKSIEKDMDVVQFFPDSLLIEGDIKTETLKRSIYDVVVYGSHIDIIGKFTLPQELFDNDHYALNECRVCIGISDLKGIKDQLYLTFGDSTYKMESGVRNCYVLSTGANTTVKIDKNSLTVPFKLSFNLNGSCNMSFVPIGETTEVRLKSNCPTPSFNGAFLPEDREVTESGFTSYWKVLNLNRNYGQKITNNENLSIINDSSFGVDVLVPVQHYQKATRCTKYAIMIILLSFVVCFLTELIQKKNIHPFQYLLVGLALCLFYSLLVSLSEHIGFSPAYIIAALMTTVMLTLYLTAVLKEKKMGRIIGGLLLGLYLYVFVLIRLETYALLAGSLGLFCILAGIMYMSQKIDWNEK